MIVDNVRMIEHGDIVARTTNKSSSRPTFESRKLDAHYAELKIQPIEIIEADELSYHEACIVKYILRWREKNGLDDLLKVKWYVERIIERVNNGEDGPYDGS